MPATARPKRARPKSPVSATEKDDDVMVYGPIIRDITYRRMKSIRIIDTFRLCLHFNDDFIAELDFQPFVSDKKAGPMRKPLVDPAFFAQVYLDYGALTWPNGYDLCPFTLRHWAEQGRCD